MSLPGGAPWRWQPQRAPTLWWAAWEKW
jgi:hypothetical protein